MFKELPDVMTVKEVASCLKISQKSVYILLQEGHLCHRKIGRIYRIPKTAILKYLQNN